jgi:hypothetical protein
MTSALVEFAEDPVMMVSWRGWKDAGEEEGPREEEKGNLW